MWCRPVPYGHGVKPCFSVVLAICTPAFLAFAKVSWELILTNPSNFILKIDLEAIAEGNVQSGLTTTETTVLAISVSLIVTVLFVLTFLAIKWLRRRWVE